MGKPSGFIEFPRVAPTRRPAELRVLDWHEVYEPMPEEELRRQGGRCMDCGIPFCHQGCPLGNMIPDWDDLVYRGRWRDAIDRLHATNNFPEFTGRLCPAPCEASCVLGINADPVAIKQVEVAVIDRAWAEDWVRPERPRVESGKRVAVLGSGPAGLAAAQQLRRAGHGVTVFERADRIGGLLRYGIPEFKMEKAILDRRLDQMAAEGVEFRTGVDAGRDISGQELLAGFEAVVLCLGATTPRSLAIPGRELSGIHQAMEYLPMANRYSVGDAEVRDGRQWVAATPPYGKAEPAPLISAAGLDVIIIGGGDTGADCLGTAHRQGARSVTQFEIVPRPPETRAAHNPWPQWNNVFRVSSAHEEGGGREYSINTQAFLGGDDGRVRALVTSRCEFGTVGGRPGLVNVPETEQTWPAQLVLLAMGFTGTERGPLLEQLGLTLDSRGNIPTDPCRRTPTPRVFAAGDAARGQSLIVWAIAEGRQVAAAVDRELMGDTDLPEPLTNDNHQRPFG